MDAPECDDLFRSSDVRGSGTYTFAADGTGTSDVSLDMDLELSWSADCLGAVSGVSNVDVAASCPMKGSTLTTSSSNDALSGLITLSR